MCVYIGLPVQRWKADLRNDALGYFLWARCQLALAGKMPFSGDHLKLCGALESTKLSFLGVDSL